MISLSLLQGKNSWLPGQEVVVTIAVGVMALVEKLEVARIDRHGLIRVVANQVTMTDVVGPGGATVGFAREGLIFTCRLGCPLSAETAGREGAEITMSGGTDRLDDHEVLAVTLAAVDGVHLDRLEQIVGRAAEDLLVLAAEASGEVIDRHAGSVDLAIVAGKEKIHIRIITNHSLINGTGT